MKNIPKGFRLGTAGAGFRRPGRDDLGLIISDQPAVAAGVFTTNAFKAAPVQIAQETLRRGPMVQGVLVNSGQANACTGEEGLRNCRATLDMVGRAAGVDPWALLPMSTGVIGDQLKMDLWEKAVPALVNSLGGRDAETFTRAMMTTDAFPKFVERSVTLSGGMVRLVGMAKGAGMICPNMATMLSVVLCDARVSVNAWQDMFRIAVARTFNRVTVDGDTSTNDTVLGLANGASGVDALGADAALLEETLEAGEGATKVLHIRVIGAADVADAEKVARTVGHSQLVKTAMYGRDANWGRIVAAVGRSGARFRSDDVQVRLCGVELFRDGRPVPGNHDAKLAEPLKQRDLDVEIRLGTGEGEYTLLASDLSHDYVTCNADYRT